jgi:5'-nucleotidase (lipoprotein e(P4) family)
MQIALRRLGWTAALAAALLAGCAGRPPAAPAEHAGDPAHFNLNAVLWMQRAVEYEATTRSAFFLAGRQLEAALADPAWDALPHDERAGLPLAGLPPAVIVDADETLLDNSPFQAGLIRDGGSFSPPRWLGWVDERRARAIPGALEFALAATERGVTVLYVTNRRTPEEHRQTVENLLALGFPLAADESNLLLLGDPRGPGSEKSARRRWAAAHYRILLMLGDNLGDFVDQGELGLAARDALVAAYRDWWGERWIMLPNPSYGSWESAILRDCAAARAADPVACRRAALRHD